jgi:hypothetical protein
MLLEKKAGDPFQMSLGADREVKIKREKIKDKIKETYFAGIERKNVIRELAFDISLENLKNRSVKVRIIDSIPVSRTDRIEVKDLKVTPEPSEKNYRDMEGVCLWEYELQPGEKQTVKIEFTAIYPKDAPIFGL